jgi:NADH-quinone oxidoreductase subunit C
MLGISFRGHPDMRRLLLSDDWPEGIPPLRRKYTL